MLFYTRVERFKWLLNKRILNKERKNMYKKIKETYEKNKTDIGVTFGDKTPGLAEQIQKITSKGVV